MQVVKRYNHTSLQGMGNIPCPCSLHIVCNTSEGLAPLHQSLYTEVLSPQCLDRWLSYRYSGNTGIDSQIAPPKDFLSLQGCLFDHKLFACPAKEWVNLNLCIEQRQTFQWWPNMRRKVLDFHIKPSTTDSNACDWAAECGIWDRIATQLSGIAKMIREFLFLGRLIAY